MCPEGVPLWPLRGSSEPRCRGPSCPCTGGRRVLRSAAGLAPVQGPATHVELRPARRAAPVSPWRRCRRRRGASSATPGPAPRPRRSAQLQPGQGPGSARAGPAPWRHLLARRAAAYRRARGGCRSPRVAVELRAVVELRRRRAAGRCGSRRRVSIMVGHTMIVDLAVIVDHDSVKIADLGSVMIKDLARVKIVDLGACGSWGPSEHDRLRGHSSTGRFKNF